MSKITLKNMEFYAYHGCLKHEKTLGNTFLVTLSFDSDTAKAEQSDCLEDTLNYQLIYDTIQHIVSVPVNLIEHLGNNIADTIMKNFPTINRLQLTLSKLNPPLGAKVESVSIEIEKERLL